MSDTVKIWQARIGRAEGLQKTRHDAWKDSVALYNCTYFDKIKGGFDPERVDVNFGKWYVDNLVPLVYFRDPRIFIKCDSDKYSSFADTMEEVVNHEWKRLKLKQQNKKVILSGFLMPPGWIKFGYTAEIGQDVAKLEDIKQKSLIQDIKNTITGIFKKEKDEKTPEEQGVVSEYIKEESIFAKWVPSWNMLLPEGYQNISDMPYIIEREDMTRIDFEAHPLYKNKTIRYSRTVNDNTDSKKEIVTTPSYNKSSISSDDELNVIRLYHIWDKRSQKRYTISMESNEPHFEGDWCYDGEGFPYKPLMFEDSVPDLEKSNPYPSTVFEPIMSQIIEKSLARTQMVKWRKRSSSIILAAKNQLTEEDWRQLQETEAVQLVNISNPQAVVMSQSPNLPNGVFDVNAIIDQDLQMGTNMGQMMFGAQKGTRTATQAQIGQSGLQLKSSARVDVVEDFTVEEAIYMAQLIWQFYDRDKIKEIIGKEVTPNMWLDLPDDKKERRRIIQSELQFRIDAGSTAPPKDETVDRKQLLDFLSFAASFAPERLKKDETLKAGIKRWKFVKDIDKIVIGFDDEEKRLAMEENQLMLQGHPQTVGPNEPHDVHIQIHQQASGHPLVDQHIMLHGQRMGIIPEGGKDNQGSQQDGGPQDGDVRPPQKSIKPEQTRQGIPSQGGIYQSVQNQGVGSKGAM